MYLQMYVYIIYVYDIIIYEYPVCTCNRFHPFDFVIVSPDLRYRCVVGQPWHKHVRDSNGATGRVVVRADALLAPVARTHRQERTEMQIRGPDYDLIPVAMFKKYANGKTPSEAGVPLISIRRTTGTSITGVLLWANHWNPPAGCWRVSSFEAILFIYSISNTIILYTYMIYIYINIIYTYSIHI